MYADLTSHPVMLQRDMGEVVLKRFLLMVLLLDQVATSGCLPAKAPLLFRIDSPIKSSAQVSVTRVRHGVLKAENVFGTCIRVIYPL